GAAVLTVAPAAGGGRRRGRRHFLGGIRGVGAGHHQDPAHRRRVDGARVAVAARLVGRGELAFRSWLHGAGVELDVVEGGRVRRLPVVLPGHLPPGATDTSGSTNLRSCMETLAWLGAVEAAAAPPPPAAASPVTVSTPFMAAGWTSQWNGKVPALGRGPVPLVPAKRPPSAPGVIVPVSKEPSSAVRGCGLPPMFAPTRGGPAWTSSCGGSKRSLSPSLAGSVAWMRLTRDGWAPAVTSTTPFILAGLMRQKYAQVPGTEKV